MSYIKHTKWDEMVEQAIDDIVDAGLMDLDSPKCLTWCKCDEEEGDNPECPRHRKLDNLD